MENNISVSLAKKLMKILPVNPTIENKPHDWEIFQHEKYTQANEQNKKSIRFSSSQARYEYEKNHCFFDNYFPDFNKDDFADSSCLEIGSFTGGSLVYWEEKYGYSNPCGIDINPIFALAGDEFAKEKGAKATFKTGFGESLPYPDNSFDYIVSFDVFEHVKNVELVMQECFRVLKKRGKILLVFPQFFQPLEAHLTYVTKTPALHWFFSSKTLVKAYNEIIEERGKDAYWYALEKKELSEWERLPSLNGITVKKFRDIINKKSWEIDYWGKTPILSDGRKSKMLLFRILRKFFVLPARLPILEELFLGRICCVLVKDND